MLEQHPNGGLGQKEGNMITKRRVGIAAALTLAILLPVRADATPERMRGYASSGCRIFDHGKGKRFECGPGSDVARGTIFADVFHMGSGHDRVGARAGKDLVKGGEGVDTIYGKHGDDRLIGGRGADSVLDSGGDGDKDIVLVHPGAPDNVDIQDGDGFDIVWYCPGAAAYVLRDWFDSWTTVAC